MHRLVNYILRKVTVSCNNDYCVYKGSIQLNQKCYTKSVAEHNTRILMPVERTKMQRF